MNKLIFCLALFAGSALLAGVSSASAAEWVMIDGTQSSWWIDTDSFTHDAGGVTIFKMVMSDQPGIPPDRAAQLRSGEANTAIDCKTGHEYLNSSRHGWEYDPNKWPPEYHDSVRHIVCKQ
jgi:hypothetical protein